MIKIKLTIEDGSSDMLEILLEKEIDLNLDESSKYLLVESFKGFLARLDEFY